MNRVSDYEMLDESLIPKCCGSCIFIRYKNTLDRNKPSCKIIEETVCVFAKCSKFRPNNLIWVKEGKR